MKKILTTLAFFASVAMFSQSNATLQQIQEATNLDNFVNEDVAYIDSLVELSAQEEAGIRDLITVKYQNLKQDASQERVLTMHKSFLERARVILPGEKLEILANTEGAIPVITGLIYLNN